MNYASELKTFITEQLKIESLGLESTNKTMGYIVMQNGNDSLLKAYRYNVSKVVNQNARAFVSYTPFKEYNYSISCNINSIKNDLISTCKTHYPQIYILHSKIILPWKAHNNKVKNNKLT